VTAGAAVLVFAQGPTTGLHADSRAFTTPSTANPVPSERLTPKLEITLLQRPIHPGPVRVDVDMVVLSVLVTDSRDRIVSGLNAGNFEIYDDRVPQQIITFSREDAPVSVGIVFDSSGSMANKIDRSKAAALEFLKTSNPQDQFMLINVNGGPPLVSGFTPDLDDLQTQLATTQAGGRTALLDAIYLAVVTMRNAPSGRKALLVISDGGDNHSRHNEADLRRLIQESDVQIYAVGVFTPAGFQRRAQEEVHGPELLREIAEESGGRMYSTTDSSQLPGVTQKISTELRNLYAIGYRPSNLIYDGRWRRVQVKLRPPSGSARLRVYGRTGYYAPVQ
jgi:Ca-activated chloride channel family protein